MDIYKKFSFDSAHFLPNLPDDHKCKRMHGHNWKVEVEVSGNKLDNIGMVMDFKDIKKSAKEIGGRLDHQFLNDLEPFKENNPTAENIAKYFFSELSKKINNDSIELKSIKLWETDKSAVKYTE